MSLFLCARWRNKIYVFIYLFIYNWWSTLKSAVFGLGSSLPPLVGGCGRLVCELVGKADLLSDHLDGKQSRESVDLPLTYHPSPRFTTFAFRSSEVRLLLLHRPIGYVYLFFFRELLMIWS